MNEPHALPESEPPAAEPAVRPPGSRLVAWMRWLLGGLTIFYVIGLVVLLVALEWWGERNWVLSLFLYAPAQLPLAPLVLLTPACLLLRWRLLGWHLAAVAVVLLGYMTFRWTPLAAPAEAEITAVTFNCGESDRAQFFGFLQQEKPDLIFLQDARTRVGEVFSKNPEMAQVRLGQFAVLSRFPLEKAAVVESAQWMGQAVAIRCETTIAGRRTALYSVHLPTPRRELTRFIDGARNLGEKMGSPYLEPVFEGYREWLAARIELAKALARVFADEPLPMIVGGDFNTPDHGYIYHQFARTMDDAFAHAGRGWGLTFPGTVHNRVAFFGPWLRLDYFFTGAGWKAMECRPEPGGKSQHKAVFARFRAVDVRAGD